MFELVDLDLSLPKAQYKRKLSGLQSRFYDLAHALFLARIPSMVVFEGLATAGKGSMITVLTERLDARGFRVVPVMPPRTYETHYPWLRRFWLRIPARGEMAIFDQSWYRRVLIDRLLKTVRKREWRQAYDDIADFEAQLATDGTLITKFWLHIGKKEQSKRLKKLLKNKLTRWQVSEEDSLQHKSYEKYLKAAEEMIARTDVANAPWTIVEATDKYFARVKVYETLIRAFERRLAAYQRGATAKETRRA